MRANRELSFFWCIFLNHRLDWRTISLLLLSRCSLSLNERNCASIPFHSTVGEMMNSLGVGKGLDCITQATALAGLCAELVRACLDQSNAPLTKIASSLKCCWRVAISHAAVAVCSHAALTPCSPIKRKTLNAQLSVTDRK